MGKTIDHALQQTAISTLIFLLLLWFVCFTSISDVSFWCNRRVVELGSGCGLVGMYTAMLGSHVIITDMKHVKQHMQHNLNINFGKGLEVSQQAGTDSSTSASASASSISSSSSSPDSSTTSTAPFSSFHSSPVWCISNRYHGQISAESLEWGQPLIKPLFYSGCADIILLSDW